MQIKITARHGHLSDAAQQMVREKASKLTHFFDRLTMIEVTVDLGNDLEKVVEILAAAEHKHDFVAREVHTDLQVALDQAVQKLERQITRYKEKIQDHRRDQHVGDISRPAGRG
ncbi:MAG: ribosome hibernation-promoting factor, HPF/YfiA family [Gemmataceae bacterium]